MPKTYPSSEQSTERLCCPSCFSTAVSLFHEVADTPVNSVLNIPSHKEAMEFPRGRISLGFCRGCGFIYNTCFDSEKVHYCSECEESQAYSPTFSNYALGLARELVNKYDLRKKSIVEIGCGKGEFLKLICRLGNNEGFGFDPAYVPDRGGDDSEARVTFIRDFYSEQYSDYHGDLICCRMTLEHIDETARLVSTVRESIGDRKETTVFFQVPDVTRILRDCAFEDIYYEHCSYFSPGSLARLFRANRFEVVDIRTDYDGQYIHIEARPAAAPTGPRFHLEDDLDFLEAAVGNFRQCYEESISYWQKQLADLKLEGQRVIIWGSGSRAVAFLNTLDNSGIIHYVVDINPHRQGTHMAGTGQEVVPPGFLQSYQPNAVIVMNSIYREEIRKDLEELGLDPDLYVLGMRQAQLGKVCSTANQARLF